MRYKNPLIALVLAGLAGIGASAYAVNLDTPAGTTAQYASELVIPPAGLPLTGGAPLAVSSIIGFGISNGEDHSFRYDIAPAVFTSLADTDLVVPGATSTISSGGTGSTFVIYDVVVAALDPAVPQSAVAVLTIPGVTVLGQSSNTVRFGNYQTATGAATQTDPLYENSGTLLAFTNALTVEATPVIPDLIDVATNSTEFVLGLTDTLIGRITATVETGVLWSDGAQTNTADLLAAGPAVQQVVVTGDFSAAQDLDAGVPDGNFTGTFGDVYADNDVDGSCSLGAGDVFATGAVGGFDGATANLQFTGGGDPVIFDWDICYTVNGVSEIADGPVQGAFDVIAALGANTPDTDLGIISVLEKNGDSAFANFVLTPQSEGGVFRNWGRVCNNSAIDGRVFVRLTNDLGDTVAFELGDVAGQVTTLGGNECTAQILVDDFYAAGQATDPTFSVGTGGRNKLRAEFEGEFPVIDVDNITVSRDNNTFNLFD